MVRDTSLLAFYSVKEDLGLRQALVLEQIRKVPLLTAKEISHNMGYSDPNSVRPRITELQKKGLIKAYSKRECRVSGKVACCWGVL